MSQNSQVPVPQVIYDISELEEILDPRDLPSFSLTITDLGSDSDSEEIKENPTIVTCSFSLKKLAPFEIMVEI